MLIYLQFQNSSRDNKCKCYQLAEDWNFSKLGPVIASGYITTTSCISCIKMLFGQPTDDSTDSALVLPQNWGNTNRSYVATWISDSKLNNAAMVELEMHNEPNADQVAPATSDEEEEMQEEGEEAAEQEEEEEESEDEQAPGQVEGLRPRRRLRLGVYYLIFCIALRWIRM